MAKEGFFFGSEKKVRRPYVFICKYFTLICLTAEKMRILQRQQYIIAVRNAQHKNNEK